MALNGKVVVVTGAGTGIGEALALALLKEGCRVVLAGRRVEKLQAVKQRSTHPEHALVVQTDVSSYAGLEQLVNRALEAFGRIDILINNAGVSYSGSLTDLSPQEVEYALRVNLVAPIWLTQLAVPSLLKQPGGMVVNLSSLGGLVPLPHQSVYCAAKSGISGFSHSIRRELGPQGIQVLVVYPGGVETEMMTDELKGIIQASGTHAPALMPAAIAAAQVVQAMKARRGSIIVGAAKEKFFYRMNGLLPGLVDRVLAKMGPLIQEGMRVANRLPRSRNAQSLQKPN